MKKYLLHNNGLAVYFPQNNLFLMLGWIFILTFLFCLRATANGYSHNTCVNFDNLEVKFSRNMIDAKDVIGCHNSSQSDSGGVEAKDTLSTIQVAHGINIEMISLAKFTAVRSVRIVLPKDAGPVLKNIAALFARQVQQRCKAKVEEDHDAALTVELAIESGIGAEGFKIADGKAGTIRIIGNDERGILYGIGKFLRTSRYDQGGFTAGTWRGTSVPEKPFRVIYLATHFHNFYHVASIAEVQQYVEDVALWGYNVLLVWYDMHHFSGFNDPVAVKFRVRLHEILKAAKSIGLDVAWGDVANGGYNNRPAAIRAVKCINKGTLETDIDPRQPGGTEYILANSAQLLREFADLRPKYYFIADYDDGGCCCERDQPWATNGYPRMAKLLSDQMRKYVPEAKIVLDTWLFSADELLGFDSLMKQSPGMADYVMFVANSVNGKPKGYSMISFPDITMLGWGPWGGYGAAPLPDRLQTEWREKSRLLSGGMPYSEGIWDDINKALYAQFYWQPDRPAEDIVKEYIAFEYSPDVVDDMTRAIGILERNHKRQDINENLSAQEAAFQKAGINNKGVNDEGQGRGINESAEEAFQLIQKTEAKLTLQARRAWRWRIVYLRAIIDREIFRTVPRPVFKPEGDKGITTASIPGPHGEALSAAFKELRAIYHAEKIGQRKIDLENVGETLVLPPQVLTNKRTAH